MTSPVPLNQLLAAVNVERGACEGRVGHDVHGQRGHVGWADHPADRQSVAQLLATRVQLIAEERRRQRCVHKAGGDEVDANGREFQRQIPRHGRHRGRKRRDESEALRRAPAPGAAHEEQGASGANFVCGATCDLQREQQVGLDVAARPFKIQFSERRVLRSGPVSSNDRSARVSRRKPREALEVGGIESHRVRRAELARYVLQRLGIPRCEHQLRSLGIRQSGGLEPTPALPPITTTVCPAIAVRAGAEKGCATHDSSS